MKNNQEFTKIITKNENEFNRLNDCLHDEYLDIDKIQYKEKEQTLEIPYHRIFHWRSSRTIKNWLIYRVLEVDVLKCLLIIKDVKRFDIIDRANIGTYSIDSLQYHEKSNQLKLILNEDCEIRMWIGEIDIEYKELEFNGKSKIRYFLFLESDNGKVYY